METATGLFTSGFIHVYSRILAESFSRKRKAKINGAAIKLWNKRCERVLKRYPTDPQRIYETQLNAHVGRVKNPTGPNFNVIVKQQPKWDELRLTQQEPIIRICTRNEHARQKFFEQMASLSRTPFQAFQMHANRIKLFAFPPNQAMYRALPLADKLYYARVAQKERSRASTYFYKFDASLSNQVMLIPSGKK